MRGAGRREARPIAEEASEQLGLDEGERLAGLDRDCHRPLIACQGPAVGEVLVAPQNRVDANPLQGLAQGHDVVERLAETSG